MRKPISSDISRKYGILMALKNTRKPTMSDLVAISGLSEATVKRHIADLRNDFGMVIDYNNSTPGDGYYVVLDYGWISMDKMELHLSSQVRLD